MRTDILNFEFSTRSTRDIGIVEPVLCYLEMKYSLNIKRFCCRGNFPEIIRKHNPKMVILANGIGTKYTVEIVKYCYYKGIKVVTFISEGDCVDMKENVEILFWGNNTERIFYENLNLQWSQKNIDYIRKYIDPEKKYNLKLSGGTGFDRYKFLPLLDKKVFLKKYNLEKYSEVIGLGGFPFYFFLSDMYKKDGQFVNMHLDPDACIAMAESKEPLRLIYKKIIINNPDKLFILKYHPMELYKELSEFHELEELPNTISFVKEERIEDIINVSDLWISFESTTCLEAWLLGKQTFLINPERSDFPRSKIADGSPVFKTFEDSQKAIDTYFSSGNIPEFQALESKREFIIKNAIDSSDGKNHIRAADFIKEVFDSPQTSAPVDKEGFVNKIVKEYKARYFKKSIRKNLPFLKLIPAFSHPYLADRMENLEYNSADRQKFYTTYREALKKFYSAENIHVN
ncbi:MAG: hypothetical protein H7321_02385 [Bacteroidia bacterium]|nr:hypothetical protein [Bacteroidia bacterium]